MTIETLEKQTKIQVSMLKYWAKCYVRVPLETLSEDTLEFICLLVVHMLGVSVSCLSEIY